MNVSENSVVMTNEEDVRIKFEFSLHLPMFVNLVLRVI